MITKAALANIFGSGANQDANYLRVPIEAGRGAESILVSLLANLLRTPDALLQAEDGVYLTDELGNSLSGFLLIPTIEVELWEIVLLPNSRISRVFVGINEAL